MPEPFVSSSLGDLSFSDDALPGSRDDEPPGGDSPLCFIAGLPRFSSEFAAIRFRCCLSQRDFLPPLEDFEPEPDDFDEPPDLEPEDFLAAEAPERLLEERPEALFEEPLFDEDDFEPPLFDDEERELPLPLFDDVERELPLFDEDDRELPLFEEDDPLFEEEPFDEEPFDEDPEALRLDDPEEPLRDVPEDLLLLPPLEDFPLDDFEDPDDFEEPLLDEDPERPPLELRRDDEDPPEPDRLEPLVDPPLPPAAFAANADCTTFAAPSTAPIAAAVARLPAASAAFANKPLLSFLREDPFDDVLFFDFDFVVAI